MSLVRSSKTFSTEAEAAAFLLGFSVARECKRDVVCDIDQEEPIAVNIDYHQSDEPACEARVRSHAVCAVNADELSDKFNEVLREWLGAKTLAEVVERNRGRLDNTCATHDFCDANEAMTIALRRCKYYGEQTGSIVNVVNKAWDKSCRDAFGLDQTILGIHSVRKSLETMGLGSSILELRDDSGEDNYVSLLVRHSDADELASIAATVKEFHRKG